MLKKIPLRIADALLMLTILTVAVMLMLLPALSSPSEYAQIIIGESGEVRTVSLSSDGEYEIVSRDIALCVRVDDGEIFVISSSCRDGICRSTPPISRSGQSIICAPAGVVIRVVGEEAYVDGISG